MSARTGIDLRPVRPSDRQRVAEMVANVWEGHDYIPEVFDEWVSDPGAWFQAAEVGGEVVGVQRVRAIAEGIAWYEGLRVAPEHRRKGVARAMLEAAVAQARGSGFREVRLASANPDAIALFRTAGFELIYAARLWRGRRVEGDEPAPMPGAGEAERLLAALREDPVWKIYQGVIANGEWALDIDAPLLAQLATEGSLRVGAGGRALAATREGWGGDRLWAYFVSGSGGALQDLLLRLRFEADSLGLEGVNLWAPDGHPGEEDFAATGYDSGSDSFHLSYFRLRLDR